MQYANEIEETLVQIDGKVDTASSSSKAVTTPLCTPRPPLERSKSRSSIKTTPVNRKRSNNRRRSSFNRTMNVTNLNILFDSSYINQNTPPQEEKKTWQSPRSNGSTQTINLDYQLQSSPAIVETPKLSQFTLEELVSQIKSPPKGPSASAKNVQEKQSGVEVIFNRLKRLSRTSVRWSYKILDFCNYIGVALKRSLSSICSAYRVESAVETVETETILCKCSEYKKRIRTCSSDIDQLKTELYQVRSQIEIQRDYEQKIKELSEDYEQKIRILSEELHHVKEEFEEFRGFKNEFEDFKQHFRNNHHTPSPAVAPPPPPPPPPPPLPPQPPKTPVRLSIKKSNRSNKENSRPIISLDDILKVKLKKTADRPTPYRRSTQPTISTEMLKQVKLKPSLRTHTPVELEALSTSPRSSLTRLLNNDNSVCKIKRLKRTGGYSFDDVYRRNQLAKRERERTYN